MLVTIGWQDYKITRHAGYNWMVALFDHPTCLLQFEGRTIGKPTMLVTIGW